MPWDSKKLNDGREIPGLGFGTWKLGNGEGVTNQVDQAISLGLSHIDTAQVYRNETEAGTAIRESGLAREDVFITTKYSGLDGLDVHTSIRNSLDYMGLKYVDLYLVHSPRLAKPDIPTFWKEMEVIKKQGLVKSIGVSNYDEKDLALLVSSAKIKPVVNQILLHPYVYARQKPILEFAAENDIVIEAYSALLPITSLPGGPLDTPLNDIAGRLGVTTDQVLLAWTKAKGAVVVTTSSKKSRLEGYLNAGDLKLTEEDMAAIDAAGALGPPRSCIRNAVLRRLVVVGAVGAISFAAAALTGYLSFL
ncbi:Aldo/keto reductase [Roridomyces roridus]|uniref:Aldo/keto reductase n=1 Tax=Roridomyces roridus TaxID=1738132 RepID=A0AAD7BHP4_9AGAR|nr:Aldo/keto reductase [Roridomyces roridus]